MVNYIGSSSHTNLKKNEDVKQKESLPSIFFLMQKNINHYCILLTTKTDTAEEIN